MKTIMLNEKIAVIQAEELEQFKRIAERAEEILKRLEYLDFKESYIESKKLPELLGISTKTWQTWRDKRYFPFIQFGVKIWVKRSDLEAFLESHYVKVKAC
jgi:hypothetical protein